jgi:hypothetical protein
MRLTRIYEFIKLFKTDKDLIKITFLREGQILQTHLQGIDVTSHVDKAEKNIIKSVCHDRHKKKQVNLKSNQLCL